MKFLSHDEIVIFTGEDCEKLSLHPLDLSYEDW